MKKTLSIAIGVVLLLLMVLKIATINKHETLLRKLRDCSVIVETKYNPVSEKVPRWVMRLVSNIQFVTPKVIHIGINESSTNYLNMLGELDAVETFSAFGISSIKLNETLKLLDTVKEVSLFKCGVDKQTIRIFGKMKELGYLHFSGVDFAFIGSDNDLGKTLVCVGQIVFHNCKDVTSAIMMINKRSLSKIIIDQCEIGMDMLGEVFQKCQYVKEVGVQGKEVTNEINNIFKYLQNVQILHLSNTQIDDKCIEHIMELVNLKTLHLSGCNITDNSISEIIKHPSIDTVYAIDTRISDEGRKTMMENGVFCW